MDPRWLNTITKQIQQEATSRMHNEQLQQWNLLQSFPPVSYNSVYHPTNTSVPRSFGYPYLNHCYGTTQGPGSQLPDIKQQQQEQQQEQEKPVCEMLCRVFQLTFGPWNSSVMSQAEYIEFFTQWAVQQRFSSYPINTGISDG